MHCLMTVSPPTAILKVAFGCVERSTATADRARARDSDASLALSAVGWTYPVTRNDPAQPRPTSVLTTARSAAFNVPTPERKIATLTAGSEDFAGAKHLADCTGLVSAGGVDGVGVGAGGVGAGGVGAAAPVTAVAATEDTAPEAEAATSQRTTVFAGVPAGNVNEAVNGADVRAEDAEDTPSRLQVNVTLSTSRENSGAVHVTTPPACKAPEITGTPFGNKTFGGMTESLPPASSPENAAAVSE
jgi:hypothetical protein